MPLCFMYALRRLALLEPSRRSLITIVARRPEIAYLQ
jgi:hypothetical protein